MPPSDTRPRVGLFVTCLVDLFRPEVGFATVALLERAGCRVEVPPTQTCCGQPAFNSGDRATTTDLARAFIAAFDGYDYVVAPSGSCTGMLHHYPELFAEGDPWRERAEALKARAYEITGFLVDVLGAEPIDSRFNGTVTYHDACSGLRELGIRTQPRRLLARVRGLRIREMAEAGSCCGFGGTFCVKFADISNQLVTGKCGQIAASGADTVLAGDMGCLLNIAGKLRREGSPVAVRHVVEVLAGNTDAPSIGEGPAGH